jgi:hypothetical protein
MKSAQARGPPLYRGVRVPAYVQLVITPLASAPVEARQLRW